MRQQLAGRCLLYIVAGLEGGAGPGQEGAAHLRGQEGAAHLRGQEGAAQAAQPVAAFLAGRGPRADDLAVPL